MRVVVTLALVVVVGASVVLGLWYTTEVSSGVFAGVALATAATGYWLLRRGDTSPGWAIGGAVAATVLSNALAFAILVQYLVD